MANATLNLATPMASTTLTGQISPTATYVTLPTLTLTAGAYSNVQASAPQWSLAIDGEIMDVEFVVSTTNFQLQVVRGTHGTVAGTHGNGALVWAAPTNNFPDPAPFGYLSFTPRFGFSTLPGLGQVVWASIGNNTTMVAGTVYIADLNVGNGFLTTGLRALIGGTAGTDSWTCYLYDTTLTNVLANSALTAVGSTANRWQNFAWAQQCYIPAGHYYVAVQSNGTHATLTTIGANTTTGTVGTSYESLTTSATGTSGTAPVVTVPVTFTANVGPIAVLY